MQVSQVVSLTFKDGPQIFIPESLIHEDFAGQRWLKFRPSSATLAKLVLGHMQDFRKLRNPSLANSPQIRKIQEKIRTAVLGQANENAADGNMFEEQPGEEGESQEKSKKQVKDILQKAPATVEISLGSASEVVTVKKPNSWKETDIYVPLEDQPLTLVCDYILEDVEACFSEKKREYCRTGQFSRKKAKREDEED